jgi:hypothetical protein
MDSKEGLSARLTRGKLGMSECRRKHEGGQNKNIEISKRTSFPIPVAISQPGGTRFQRNYNWTSAIVESPIVWREDKTEQTLKSYQDTLENHQLMYGPSPEAGLHA